jgi:hypothetical protein
MTTSTTKTNARVHATFVGKIGDEESVYYSKELNQVYLVDSFNDSTKTLTHEEFTNLCDMREKIESLA